MCWNSKRRSKYVVVTHATLPSLTRVFLGLPRAHLHAATTGKALPRYMSSALFARAALFTSVTGVYFSLYAVGMVGTAYGIYSLAFVRPFRATRILASLTDKRPLAVQAHEKGLNTRIDLIHPSVHAYTR
jgi:hypothetical protein